MELLTEHRPVQGPIVYGYLHLPTASTARRIALTESLTEYCRQHELLLSGVFTERSRITTGRPPAFTGLLDVLAMLGTYGAVLPSTAHLGPTAVAGEREQRITATGARLLLVRATRRQRGASRAPLPRHRVAPAVTVLDGGT